MEWVLHVSRGVMGLGGLDRTVEEVVVGAREGAVGDGC